MKFTLDNGVSSWKIGYFSKTIFGSRIAKQITPYRSLNHFASSAFKLTIFSRFRFPHCGLASQICQRGQKYYYKPTYIYTPAKEKWSPALQ